MLRNRHCEHFVSIFEFQEIGKSVLGDFEIGTYWNPWSLCGAEGRNRTIDTRIFRLTEFVNHIHFP